MSKNIFVILILCGLLLQCKHNTEYDKVTPTATIPKVIVTGKMKDVMWKGELFGKIKLDTIQKSGLYGLGPEAYLTGEILINDGEIYRSKVLSDSVMTVEITKEIEAPFFVHSTVTNWTSFKLPNSIKTVSDIENYITNLIQHFDQPFAFRLEGEVNSAEIHIQNLPKGTKVSSPKEAHQGQINYKIDKEGTTIIGFYSKHHKGVFTHHDTNLHMHLITEDKSKMGHLDAIDANSLTLYLPFGIMQNLNN